MLKATQWSGLAHPGQDLLGVCISRRSRTGVSSVLMGLISAPAEGEKHDMTI